MLQYSEAGAQSGPDSCDHGWDAQEHDDAPNVVGERGETELGTDIVEPAHQERLLAHPLFD